ncbi:MAG: hypothetical protein WC516_04130 [Patescibacteria group bacterium]
MTANTIFKNHKKQIFPNVPEVFTDGFPKNYRPWIDGWAFSEEQLKSKLSDGTYKLLTLDVSISPDDYVKEVNSGPREEISQRAEEKYQCEIGCRHCFECKTDTNNPLMNFGELKEIMHKAEQLGLESIKFLGPGELLHNPELFKILDYFENEKIKVGIFTKGVILGDDELARKLFSMPAKDFCKKLCNYSCVCLLVGLTSADPETEDQRLQTSIKNFSAKRNRGLENAARLGMNSDPACQRLALICAPVLLDNIDEAFEIFQWGVKRNIPVVLAPTMVSGKGLDMAEINNDNFKSHDLVNLYVDAYSWLIEQGIMTPNQIEKEGVSPYAGIICNQFISGMFIRKDGRIQACPGNESVAFRYCQDIRHDDLKNVWTRSLGYALRKELVETGRMTLTQPCYAKTEGRLVPKGSIAEDFYQLVMAKIKSGR